MGKDEEKKECEWRALSAPLAAPSASNRPPPLVAASGPDTRVGWVQAKLQKAFENMKGDKFTKAFNDPEAT